MCGSMDVKLFLKLMRSTNTWKGSPNNEVLNRMIRRRSKEGRGIYMAQVSKKELLPLLFYLELKVIDMPFRDWVGLFPH